jgi:hypothetical protein
VTKVWDFSFKNVNSTNFAKFLENSQKKFNVKIDRENIDFGEQHSPNSPNLKKTKI